MAGRSADTLVVLSCKWLLAGCDFATSPAKHGRMAAAVLSRRPAPPRLSLFSPDSTAVARLSFLGGRVRYTEYDGVGQLLRAHPYHTQQELESCTGLPLPRAT